MPLGLRIGVCVDGKEGVATAAYAAVAGVAVVECDAKEVGASAVRFDADAVD
jgi:hypothetical protein